MPCLCVGVALSGVFQPSRWALGTLRWPGLLPLVPARGAALFPESMGPL